MLRTLPGIERLLWQALLLACAMPAPYVVGRAAATEVPLEAAVDVMAADRAFAQLAQESGIRAAYDRYLDADAVVFRPMPVPAREWFATHEPASGRVEWTPVLATTACDSSIAVTLGSWSYMAADSRTADTGQYLTAWRRGDDGEWRIALDQSLSLPALPTAQAPAAGTCDGLASAGDRLLAAERKLNAGSRKLQANASTPLEVRAVTAGTVTGSTQADLALTHGQLVDKRAARGSEPQVRAVYVRVWQRVGRSWRVAHEFVAGVTP